jgi:hypothetical protein
MSRFTNPAKIQLPKAWPSYVRSAMLHVVSLAQYATVYTRSWAADSPNARVRLKAAKDYAEQDAALLREEMRIKDDQPVRGRSRPRIDCGTSPFR